MRCKVCKTKIKEKSFLSIFDNKGEFIDCSCCDRNVTIICKKCLKKNNSHSQDPGIQESKVYCYVCIMEFFPELRTTFLQVSN